MFDDATTDLDTDPFESALADRLREDIREAARKMTRREARFVADAFDARQIGRIRTAHQARTTRDAGEPAEFLDFMLTRDVATEKLLGVALGLFCENDHLGRWMLAQKGIGPLLAGRLIALGNWDAPNPAKCFAFAGLDPTKTWLKGQKRPWNARLKRLLYLVGESFVKVSGYDDAHYGQLYRQSKISYWARNVDGAYVEIAREERDRVKPTTEKWKWNQGCFDAEQTRRWVTNGMPRKPTTGGAAKVGEILAWIDLDMPAELRPEEMPDDLAPFLAWHRTPLVQGEPGSGLDMLAPGHVHDRARRRTVKRFLAHSWEVEWRHNNPGKEPPMPWVIEHGGHTHYEAPPGLAA